MLATNLWLLTDEAYDHMALYKFEYYYFYFIIIIIFYTLGSKDPKG